jgi:hypothetical protein
MTELLPPAPRCWYPSARTSSIRSSARAPPRRNPRLTANSGPGRSAAPCPGNPVLRRGVGSIWPIPRSAWVLGGSRSRAEIPAPLKAVQPPSRLRRGGQYGTEGGAKTHQKGAGKDYQSRHLQPSTTAAADRIHAAVATGSARNDLQTRSFDANATVNTGSCKIIGFLDLSPSRPIIAGRRLDQGTVCSVGRTADASGAARYDHGLPVIWLEEV